jgi:hypothetical protein
MEQIEKDDYEMFKIFAALHPVEAYDLDKEMFYKYVKETNPILTDKIIDNLIEESR